MSLALYDIQGRLVRTIANRQSFTKGKQNVAIDSQDLANGVYICQLITSSKKISQKIIKMK